MGHGGVRQRRGESECRCGDQQVIAVGKWDGVLLGISGRLCGHALDTPWSISEAEGSWGVYPSLLISPWLRAAVGGWFF